MKKLLSVFAAALLLTACDKKDQAPLPGERVSFLNFVTSITPDVEAQGQTVTVPLPVENSSWPQAGGYPNNLPPHAELGSNIKNIWKKNVGYGSFNGQKLITQIISDGNLIYSMDVYGDVCATHLKDGTDSWKISTSPENKKEETLGGGLAVNEQTVYITTAFGSIFAVSAVDGKVIWKKDGFSPFRTAPTIKNGHLYAQSINNELIVLSLVDGSKLWSHSGFSESTILLGGAQPAIEGDSVIVAYSSGEVYALSNENGQPLWNNLITPVARIDTVTSIPHIHAKPVVDGSQVFAISHGGRMVCLDLRTGTRQWQKDIGGIQTPLVAGDSVFVLTSSTEIVCLNRYTGKVRWVNVLPKVNNSQSLYYTGPILAGGNLILTSSQGEILRLDMTQGHIIEKIEVGESICLPPIVVNKTLIALSEGANLHAFR